MKNRFFPGLLLLASLTCAADAATPIPSISTTYVFTGVMDDPFGSIPAGTSFTGSFTYNSSQALNIFGGYRGDYVYENFSVTILGHLVADSGTGVINMYNKPGYVVDAFHLYTFNLAGSFGGIQLAPGAGLQLMFQHQEGTVFSDLSVLRPNLTLADFTTGYGTFLQLQGIEGSGSGGITVPFARGRLTSLHTVPEPSSLLASAALGGLVLLRRRRA